MKNILLLILILLVGLGLHAQGTLDLPDKPCKLRKKAKQQLKVNNYYDASDMLEKYMQLKPDQLKYAWTLAETYRLSRDYKSAEKWYAKIAEQDDKTYPLAQYYAALMMKMNGKYTEAKPMFEEFAKSFKGAEREYRKWAQIEAEGCDSALAAVQDPLKINVFHLDATVNSPYTDVSPILWDDTTLLFASLPSDTIIRVNDRDTTEDKPFINFYSSVFEGADYDSASLFHLFNIYGYHSANGAFNGDRTRFYFSRCEENSKFQIFCDLYVSELVEGAWQQPQSLGDVVNSKGYTTTQPTVYTDDKGQDIIYFSSDRPKGKGGTDIWYTTRRKNDTYTPPRNLGARINTDRDEATPYYDSGAEVLYFSSNGLVNYGGFDIFSASGSQTKWQEPVNVGYPLNGPTDDMYFYRDTAVSSTGYFVSNRPGIISVKSETCCDDIFAFKGFDKPVIAVQGYVFEDGDATQTPIDSAKVTLYTYVGNTEVELEADTTIDGMMYFFNIDFDKRYRVKGDKEGYLSGSANFNTVGRTESDTLRVDIYLKRFYLDKAYALRNIYYDYDKWFLREESKLTLDTLYQIMIDNPTIIVELGSHTDSRATYTYNIVLSQRRAESAMYYLLSKGIPQERLTAKGYGETRLLNACFDDPDCPQAGPGDCPCHQKNRRTEFKIIGELDAPLNYNDIRYEDVKGELED